MCGMVCHVILWYGKLWCDDISIKCPLSKEIPNKVDMQGLDGNRILDMTLQDNHVKYINTAADKMIRKYP